MGRQSIWEYLRSVYALPPGSAEFCCFLQIVNRRFQHSPIWEVRGQCSDQIVSGANFEDPFEEHTQEGHQSSPSASLALAPRRNLCQLGSPVVLTVEACSDARSGEGLPCPPGARGGSISAPLAAMAVKHFLSVGQRPAPAALRAVMTPWAGWLRAA